MCPTYEVGLIRLSAEPYKHLHDTVSLGHCGFLLALK